MLSQSKDASLGLALQSKIYTWDGVILYVTHEQLNNAHAHFPALLQIGLGTPFAITLDDQVRRYHDIVVMAPNVMHSTDSENQPYLALMIDPDHALYGHLYPLLNGEQICSLPAACLATFHSQFQKLIAGQLTPDEAKQLVANGVIAVSEGANMPSTPEAIRVFQEAKILYAPGKAANAGGVSVSGLEMTQNSIKLGWSQEEVDEKLKSIMKNIHEACVQYGTEADGYVNYVKGANVAGFMKVAKAMMAQGIV